MIYNYEFLGLINEIINLRLNFLFKCIMCYVSVIINDIIGML